MAPPSVPLPHRTPLHDIAPQAWEHPADRAALNALRRVPGLDVAIRALLGNTSERSIRLLHLASAVQVGPRQFPRLFGVAKEVNARFGVPLDRAPELFVAQSPFLNAGAVGWRAPFVVFNSSMLDALDGEEELAGVYGHELGHILSGHVLYKTLLALLIQLSIVTLSIPLSGVALSGLIVALREWDRKSELSSDRAGLLATQSLSASQRILMKLAGGRRIEQMDLEDFRRQAREYADANAILDQAFKLLNLLGQSHPFAVLRVVELERWESSEEYRRILRGDYPRGSAVPDHFEDLKDAGSAYSADWQKTQDTVTSSLDELGRRASSFAGGAGQTLRDWFGPKANR